MATVARTIMNSWRVFVFKGREQRFHVVRKATRLWTSQAREKEHKDGEKRSSECWTRVRTPTTSSSTWSMLPVICFTSWFSGPALVELGAPAGAELLAEWHKTSNDKSSYSSVLAPKLSRARLFCARHSCLQEQPRTSLLALQRFEAPSPP